MTEPKTKEPAGEIIEMEPANVPAPVEQGSVALMRMIEKAIADPAFDVTKMEQLLGVKERWEANEARKAFVQALAAFKADPPKIVKNRHVKFAQTEYDHATLDHICDVVGKALAAHGLSHTWQVKQHDDAAVEVTCVLTHELGHSEKVSMRGMPDSSGSKNQIQQIGSTTTYLQRYTLLAATGLAAGEDTDGGAPVEFISAEQKETLVNLMKEVGGDTKKLLNHFRIDNIDELPAAEFHQAVTAIEARRRAQNENT